MFCVQRQLQKGPLDWNRGSYSCIKNGPNVLEPRVSSHRDILLKELLLFLDLFGGSFGGSYSWFQNAEEEKTHIILGEQTVFFLQTHIDPNNGTQLSLRSVGPNSFYLAMQEKRVSPPHYCHNTEQKLFISYWLKFYFQQNWIEMI